MSNQNNELLYKIGLNHNNTPILLSISNGTDYKKELTSFFAGLYPDNQSPNFDYWNSVNTLVLDATNLKKNDLNVIFDHINVSTLEKNQYKIFILENIENLSLLLANALLKTIEEPMRFTFLIFTTNNVANVLPTIKSRCNIINITTKSQPAWDNNILLELTQPALECLLSSFKNIHSCQQWISQPENSAVVEFIKMIIDNQDNYNFLYQQTSTFTKFDYKQIRVIINWLISYFPSKNKYLFQTIIENFDLNLAKNYIYWTILEFLK